jgi:hypothetical protein
LELVDLPDQMKMGLQTQKRIHPGTSELADLESLTGLVKSELMYLARQKQLELGYQKRIGPPTSELIDLESRIGLVKQI